MAKKLIARKLPVGTYQIIDVRYEEGGRQCENCGRLIHYVATVKGQVSASTMRVEPDYRIGMDCAETLVGAREFDRHNALVKQVKKILGQLGKYEKARADGSERAADEKYNRKLYAAHDSRWHCVFIHIPGAYEIRDYDYNISYENWHALYAGIATRIERLGGSLPVDLPLKTPENTGWSSFKKPNSQ